MQCETLRKFVADLEKAGAYSIWGHVDAKFGDGSLPFNFSSLLSDEEYLKKGQQPNGIVVVILSKPKKGTVIYVFLSFLSENLLTLCRVMLKLSAYLEILAALGDLEHDSEADSALENCYLRLMLTCAVAHDVVTIVNSYPRTSMTVDAESALPRIAKSLKEGGQSFVTESVGDYLAVVLIATIAKHLVL